MWHAGLQVSDLGSSPTRITDILGCDIHVVEDNGSGDLDCIIQNYRGGVLPQRRDPQAMAKAWEELLVLLVNLDIGSCCHKAAAAVISIETGRANNPRVYHKLTDGGRKCAD